MLYEGWTRESIQHPKGGYSSHCGWRTGDTPFPADTAVNASLSLPAAQGSHGSRVQPQLTQSSQRPERASEPDGYLIGPGTPLFTRPLPSCLPPLTFCPEGALGHSALLQSPEPARSFVCELRSQRTNTNHTWCELSPNSGPQKP